MLHGQRPRHLRARRVRDGRDPRQARGARAVPDAKASQGLGRCDNGQKGK